MLKNTLFYFYQNVDISQWRIINDAVMGGVSKSEFILNNEGNGVFKGAVSLENNGGFSMVKYSFPEMMIESFTKIKISLKGDFKNYQVRIKADTAIDYSYVKGITTSDTWQKIEIELNDFTPAFRGKQLDLPNFNEHKISEIAFLIGNKKSEHFELQLNKIEFL
tara:strand:+ start:8510 stop:9001 length:492 start_codon:yes stop_codon:yes gene_type:complete